MAQTKQVDKDSQKFIKRRFRGDIAEVDVGKACAGERPE